MNPRLMKIATLKFNQAVVFGGILTFLYYSALYDNGATVDTQIAGIQTQIDAEKQKERESALALDRIKQLRESYALLTDQFKIASSQIPVEIQMSDIIRTVDLRSESVV